MKLKTKINILIPIILIIASIPVHPCTTKVSEWAMLNYPPAPYYLIYFTSGKVDKKVVQEHEELKNSIAEANIYFHTIDVSQIKDSREKAYFDMTSKKNLPFYGLFYMDRLFTQFESINDLNSLTKSLLRDNIAKELKAGKLCVLLYLKTGDEKKDNSGAEKIKKYLSNSIVKDIIPVVHLSRKNIPEKMFVKLLLKVEYDLEELNEPMLFGIFGRFRVLEPLVGEGVSIENIDYMIQFLTADCSCIIKSQMPGVSMLYLNNWDDVAPALLNNIITE